MNMAEVQSSSSTNVAQANNDPEFYFDSDQEMESDDELLQLGSELIQSTEENSKEIEELRSQVESLTVKVKEIKFLRSKNESLAQQVQDLQEEIEKLREQLKTEVKNRKSLKVQVDDLERKLSLVKIAGDKIYVCQAAAEFEQAICSEVLPEVFRRNKYATIKVLLNLINDDTQDPPLGMSQNVWSVKRSYARERWHNICDKLRIPDKWKRETGKKLKFENIYNPEVPDIFRAILLLKKERNPAAHPNPISVKKAEEKVKTAFSGEVDLPHWMITSVCNFISSLGDNIRRSGVQIDREKLNDY